MNESLVVSALAYIVPLALGWILLSFIYWKIVYPLISDSIMFKVYAARDRLRRLAIDGEIDPHSKNYRYLEEHLCSRVYRQDITLWRFARFILREGTAPTEEAKRFSETANEEEKKLWGRGALLFLLLLIANSPGFDLLLGGIILLQRGKKKMQSALRYAIPKFEKEVFQYGHGA